MPWCLYFPPTKPLVAFLGLFPCSIRAALSSSGGSSSSQQGEEPGPSLGFVVAGPGLAAQCVCSSSESLAALGQLMAGARPPCWLAPSCEKAAHSELDGGEQLSEHVSLRSLAFYLSQSPLVSFFLFVLLCPLCMLLWGRRVVPSASYPLPTDPVNSNPAVPAWL